MTTSMDPRTYQVGMNDPAPHFDALTKSDATVFTIPYRGLYVGGAGNVALVSLDGQTTTFVGCPAGLLLPVIYTQFLSTGTTATNCVGLR